MVQSQCDDGRGDVSYWHGGKLVAVKKGATVEYVHQEHLGSSGATTSTNSALVSSMTYLPYGETRSSAGTLPTERQFTGQRLDELSGLMFFQGSSLESETVAQQTTSLTLTPIFNGRYTDVELGRFIQADAIIPNPADPQAFNRYTYVINNPLSYTDPDGHAFIFALPVVPVWVYVGLVASGACTVTKCLEQTGQQIGALASNAWKKTQNLFGKKADVKKAKKLIGNAKERLADLQGGRGVPIAAKKKRALITLRVWSMKLGISSNKQGRP
jgi:RHS repeat-associated protein